MDSERVLAVIGQRVKQYRLNVTGNVKLTH